MAFRFSSLEYLFKINIIFGLVSKNHGLLLPSKRTIACRENCWGVDFSPKPLGDTFATNVWQNILFFYFSKRAKSLFKHCLGVLQVQFYVLGEYQMFNKLNFQQPKIENSLPLAVYYECLLTSHTFGHTTLWLNTKLDGPMSYDRLLHSLCHI